MDSLKLPTTAARANAFMGQGSLSFPTSSQNDMVKDEQTDSQALLDNAATDNAAGGDASSATITNNNSFPQSKPVALSIPSDVGVADADSLNPLKASVANNTGVKTADTSSTGVTDQTANAAVGDDTSASGIVPTLQNIVATVNLDCRLELKTIALHARNAEYNPKRFAAVIMRIREPKTTALIFASGKMVVTGAKSEDDSKLAARKYARIIQKLGFNAKFTDFKIQNIVGSCDVKFPIRLEGLAYAHGTFSSYEPELFPGLIYRMVKPKIVLLIFVSGKIVLTGAKQREEIYKAFEAIYPVLSEFRKN